MIFGTRRTQAMRWIFVFWLARFWKSSANAMPTDRAGGSMDDHPQVIVGGLRTARLSRRDMMAAMVADCAVARDNPDIRAKLVFTANGHSIALAAMDSRFRRELEEADLVHADGQPVVIASKWM